MPAVQTSYTQYHQAFYAGMIADQEPRRLLSRTVQDVNGIGFGKVALQGATDHSITGTGTSMFIGITVNTILLSAEAASAATGEAYPQYASAKVVDFGPVVVPVSAAVTAGQAATYDSVAGGISGAAVSGTQLAIPGGAYFDTSAAAGGLAVLRLR